MSEDYSNLLRLLDQLAKYILEAQQKDAATPTNNVRPGGHTQPAERKATSSLLTVEQAAQKLHIGQHAMYALCRRPDFPAMRLNRHTIRIPDGALDRWIEQEATTGWGGDK